MSEAAQARLKNSENTIDKLLPPTMSQRSANDQPGVALPAPRRGRGVGQRPAIIWVKGDYPPCGFLGQRPKKCFAPGTC